LTEEQAKAFNVRIDDSITITTKNMYGLNTSVDLKVVGIGNYVMLSLFSYKANYTCSDAVRELVDMKEGEATDIILFIPEKDKSEVCINSISQELKNSGIRYELTADEKLESEDLKITEMFTMLNILVIFLFIIVSILIINLVYMTGLERYREIGTLRAIGFTRFQVIRIFMGEILAVSLISGFLGVLSYKACSIDPAQTLRTV